MSLLIWLLLATHPRVAGGVPRNAYSAINSQGRILSDSATASRKFAIPSEASGLGSLPKTSIFIVSTPDEEHLTMLRNLLCSLGDSASRHDTYVMLHSGVHHSGEDSQALQDSLRRAGHERVTVFDSKDVFGDHPHWTHLRSAFPSSIKMFGVRYVLSKMSHGSNLLVMDEDVVCSPERIRAQSTSSAGERLMARTPHASVAEAIASHAPSDFAVTCAHEIPDVVDNYNNGFCLYKASRITDSLLDVVEKRMVLLGFKGDQTPFNQILREGTDLHLTQNLVPAVMNASRQVTTFGKGVIGYFRTWTTEGLPDAHSKDLFVVDSRAPETLIQWSASVGSIPSKHSELLGPLCIHYLPYSPGTLMWSKLKRHC